ncbi:hypothetical protein ELI06_04715 [Rhizobium leguminosarum]|nr:hypothetical protein ELI06_04715 [Rhizobium leguminosarum]
MRGIEEMSCSLRQNPSRIGLSAKVAQMPTPHSLIPVLVTGIQPPRVGAVKESYEAREFLASKDLDALDSCDKHRNEGVPVGPLCASGRRP